MEIKVNKKPSFKVLAKGKNFEIRIYPPVKRTVKIVGRDYFLQFPYIVFGKYSGENTDGDTGSWLHVAFADRNLTKSSLAKMVYFPSLGNIRMREWYACLDVYIGHYMQPYDLTFEDLIYKFWNNEFSTEPFHESPPLGGRYHAWQKMSLDKVLKTISKIKHKISLSHFIGLVGMGEGSGY
jgi:hypothetical protein